MREYIMSKIGRQLTAAVLGALLLACALYFLIRLPMEEAVCAYYEANPAITQEQTEGTLAALAAYVEENGLVAGDRAGLSRWMKRQPLTILHVYRDDVLLYDSTLSTASGLHTHDAPHTLMAAYESTYPVVFADGEASVSVTVFPEYRVIQVANTALLILCGLIFLALLLSCIRAKLRYFTRLEHELLSIAGGALEGGITVHGQDELARLAECIEEMRRFLVGKLQQEEARQQESYEWVTALSHDLRTPLTMLTGYLEILRRKNGDAALDTYLGKASGKAVQLKEMSDMLFSCFSPGTNPQEDACCALSTAWIDEMLSEQTELLMEKGHTVAREASIPRDIYAQPMALKRVIDNLFSNLGKYADPEVPVRVWTTGGADSFVLHIESGIRREACAQGTGLGLGICKNLMRGMRGGIEVVQEENAFAYRLRWMTVNAAAKK